MNKFIKPLISKLMIFSILSICEALILVSMPYFLYKLFQMPILSVSINDFILISGVLIIFIFALSYLKGSLCSSVSISLSNNIKEAIFNKIHSISFENINETNTANLLQVLNNDIYNLEIYIKTILKDSILNLIIFLGSIIFSFMICPKFFAFNIGIILCLVAVNYIILKKSFSFYFKAHSILSDIKVQLCDNFKNMKSIKLFNNSKEEIDTYNTSKNDNSNLFAKGIKYMLALQLICKLVIAIAILLILLFGSKAIISNTYATSSVIVFLIYALILAFSTEYLILLVFNSNNEKVSVARISNVLLMKSLNTNSESSNFNITGTISFENVSIERNNLMINNLTLNIPYNSSLGVLGNINSGKELIAALINKLYPPTEGNIKLDNIDISKYSLNDINKYVSVYIDLSPLTVNTETAIGNSDILDSIVDKTNRDSKLIQLENLNQLLAKGLYKTDYEHSDYYCLNSNNIFIKEFNSNTKILIVDDYFFENKDKYSDLYTKLIHGTLKNVTVIILSEVIDNVKFADNIILMDKGSILVEGSHEHLLNTSIHYNNIYKIQQEGSELTNE